MTQKPKFLNSITDWFLIIASCVLFGLEMLAVVSHQTLHNVVPFITDEMVEISVFQIWVPFVLGSLMGHFYPFPWRVEGATGKYLLFMFSCVGAYVLAYILVPAETLLPVLDRLADFLYAFFLGGYLLGSTFFGRARHRLEG